MGITVRRMETGEEELWRSYVDARPDATFYHRPEWKSVMERSFGHRTYYLMAQENERVAGILPVVHLRSRLFGNFMCSMPFLNLGGIVADDSEAEKALCVEAGRLLKTSGAGYLELRQMRRSSLALPSSAHKVSMYLDLPEDPDILLQGFKRRHRRDVRAAMDNGLEIRFGGRELGADFYTLLSRGWRDLGTPIYHRSFFDNILFAFDESVEIGVVYHDGAPVAAALVGFFRDTVEGMWAGNLKANSQHKANCFLYWKLIERACRNGYSRYHLGRSTLNSSGQRYKAKWNASAHQLHWEYILNGGERIPELNVENPRYRLAINIWKKMPVAITRMAGPLLAKSIP